MLKISGVQVLVLTRSKGKTITQQIILRRVEQRSNCPTFCLLKEVKWCSAGRERHCFSATRGDEMILALVKYSQRYEDKYGSVCIHHSIHKQAVVCLKKMALTYLLGVDWKGRILKKKVCRWCVSYYYYCITLSNGTGPFIMCKYVKKISNIAKKENLFCFQINITVASTCATSCRCKLAVNSKSRAAFTVRKWNLQQWFTFPNTAHTHVEIHRLDVIGLKQAYRLPFWHLERRKLVKLSTNSSQPEIQESVKSTCDHLELP